MTGTESTLAPHNEIRLPRTQFCDRFGELYLAAGNLPLRRVAAAVQARMQPAKGLKAGGKAGVSAQRISDWKSGRNVPARFESLLPVLLVLIERAKRSDVPVAGPLLDLNEWRGLWTAATAGAGDSDPTQTLCPYLGLTSYRCEDAQLFYGRARATAEFVDMVTVAADGPVVLVGASGAGKSSLLAAGLIPAFTAGDAVVAGLTPGEDPMAALRATLESTAERVDTTALLIVDQFEELFTVCRDEGRRREFLDALAGLAAGRFAVVLAIRADFYAQCLDYPLLEAALQQRSYLLGPMRPEELVEAITAPAELAGYRLEPGLEELVIAELCGQEHADRQSYDPGALPLLSHVMAAAWQRRDGRRLTVAGYRKTGGVVGSVAETAEQAWDQLTAAQRSAARQLLTGLVVVGQDFHDTRRRVSRTELLWRAADPVAAETALEALSRTRLVTLDADTVYLTHEIVVDAWPRLRGWIDEGRAGYLVRQRLSVDAAEWSASERDPSLLYRGIRLATATEQADHLAVDAPEQEFLGASRQAYQRAQRRSTVRKAVLAVLGVVVLVLALAAYSQSRAATGQRNSAVFAAVLAEADRLQESDPSLSAQLDLVANGLRPGVPDVRMRVVGTQNLPLSTNFPGDFDSVKQLSFRPDGRVLASAVNDNTVRLWDVADPARPKLLGAPLTGHRMFMTSAVFRPDGALLASAGGDHLVRLWDVHDPAHARLIGAPLESGAGTVYTLAFSPDGRTLAAPNDDGTVLLWDITDPQRPVRAAVLPRRGDAVRSVAFSPNGQLLAAAGGDRRVQLWTVTDPHAPLPAGPELDGFGSTAHTVAFHPDGRMLAIGCDDGTVHLWDVADPAHPARFGGPLAAHKAQVWSVAFSTDGRRLVTASPDSTARLWNVEDPVHRRSFGQPLVSEGSVYTAVFDPRGDRVAVSGYDGRIRMWSLPEAIIDGHGSRVGTPAFGPQTKMVTGSMDGVIQVWDIRNPRALRRQGRFRQETDFNSLVLSPDGRTLATVDENPSTIRLFDVSDPMTIRPLAVLRVAARYNFMLAFSPDSRLLVTDADDHSFQVWDLADPAHPARLGNPVRVTTDGFVPDVDFSPDGKRLAVAAGEYSGLWDMTDPAHPTRIGRVLAGVDKTLRRVKFSPDGRTLVTAANAELWIWDVTDRNIARPLGSPLVRQRAAVDSLSFSPDSRVLAAGSHDAVIRLWDIADREHPVQTRYSFTSSSASSWQVAFAPTDGYLAGSGDGGVLRLWDLDVQHAIARVCRVTRTTLTERQWHEHVPQLPYKPPCG